MTGFVKIVTLIIFSVGLSPLLKSCTKISLPEVTTTNVSAIGTTTASSGGEVKNNGGAEVTARGVCWNTNQNPALGANKTIDGSGNGTYSSDITGLTPNTTYYVKAYATNSVGTAYGNEVSFATKAVISTVQDIDGNIYNTVQIGSQTWLKENLKTTRYKDGSTIPPVSDNTVWTNLSSPGYCWYNNDASIFKALYGALYNWYTVRTGLLCPEGWHVPSDIEWTALANYLGNLTTAGGKLKEAGTNHWISPNTGATDEVGFSALPGGWRNGDGNFNWVNYGGYWWTATEHTANDSWSRNIAFDFSELYTSSITKNWGFSVRCIKN